MKRFAVAVLCLALLMTGTALAGKSQAVSWAHSLVEDAIGKMVEEGAIEPVKSYDTAFGFDGSSLKPVFLTEAAEEKYTASAFSIDGKVIIAYGIADMEVGMKYEMNTDIPEFTPMITAYESRFPEVPSERFADTTEECADLIVCCKFISRIDKNFYTYPQADRRCATTLVLVIDAAERAVAHVEYIGCDVPPVKTKQPYGQIDMDGCVEYITEVLNG